MPALSFDILARDRASKVFDQVAAKSQKTEQNLTKVGSSSSVAFGKITAGIAGAVGGFQVFDKVLASGFNRLANLDDARKRLDQMGLSTSEAAKLMEGLTDTVTGTAFSLDAGASAMTGFVSAGVDLDEVNSRLEMTADTAAFAQAPLDEIGNIFIKIQSQGKLMGEELNMLQERGVPALLLLADAAGVTAEQMRDMISRGEVDAERFFELWEQGSKGFGENNIKIEGSAKSMGDTIRGSLANAETALARLGAELLERGVPAMKALAEGTRDATDALISASEGLDSFNAKAEETVEKVAGQELDKGFFNETALNTATLGLYGVATSLKDLVTGSDDATKATGFFGDEVDRVRGVIEEYIPNADSMSTSTGASAEALAAAAAQAEAANAHLSAYMETLQAATDPVFALNAAIEDVGAAQAAYDATLADSTSTQADAEAAAFNLAAAVSKAEQAAINGDLSFDEFEGKLADWVAQNVISQAAADTLRGKVATLRGEAEDFAGNYNATVTADTSGAYTAVDSLVRWIGGRRATVGVNIRTFGGGALEFHQGGIIGAPRAHSGMLLGGLRTDERIVIGQTGERILSRRQTDAFHELLSSMGRGNSRGTMATSSVPGGAAETRFIFEFRGAEDAFVQAFRRAIRVRGGDVQVVLGS